MSKVTKPKQILDQAQMKLTAIINNAINTGKSAKEQVELLSNAVSVYKEAMNELKLSVKFHNYAHKEVNGLRVLADDKLQNKLYAVQTLGAKASRLMTEAKLTVKEERAKKQQEKQAAEEALQVALKEEVTKQQAKKDAEQNAATVILKKVDAILWNLYAQINGIGNNLPEAREVAEDLMNTLVEARDEYEYQLRNGVTYSGDPISFKEAGDLFKDTCQAAVDSAMPVLNRDLSLGEYLQNILIAIANAVVYVLTAGNKSGFFAYNKPSTDKATTANQQLQDLDVSAPSFK